MTDSAQPANIPPRGGSARLERIIHAQGGADVPIYSALILAAVLDVRQEPPSALAEAAVALVSRTPAPPVVPHVAFRIREITTASPSWRGEMIPALKPIARRESIAVWKLDSEGVERLLRVCPADPKAVVLEAPRMVARLGEPVRMTNEEKTQYVAHLERMSDGAPNEGTQIAFQPIVDEIHDGVRVEMSQTQMNENGLSAHIAVEENRVLGISTAHYTESVVKPETDPGVVKTSLLSRLKHESPDRTAITATIQIPEVASRRIEGDWDIPADGALLLSLGPHAIGGKGGKRGYQERLILIGAAVEAAPEPQPNVAP